MALGPAAHTHVSDHPQFLNVGGLSVQELPHCLLLVALPPGQLLQEGQGVARSRSVQAQPGRGRESNLVWNFLPPMQTWRSLSSEPSSATKTSKWQFHLASVSPEWVNDDNSLTGLSCGTSCPWVHRRAPPSRGIMSLFPQEREEEGCGGTHLMSVNELPPAVLQPQAGVILILFLIPLLLP